MSISCVLTSGSKVLSLGLFKEQFHLREGRNDCVIVDWTLAYKMCCTLKFLGYVLQCLSFSTLSISIFGSSR